jgi:exosome complex RNA-binding protein Rrp42 (RNase PH superfamily)
LSLFATIKQLAYRIHVEVRMIGSKVGSFSSFLISAIAALSNFFAIKQLACHLVP